MSSSPLPTDSKTLHIPVDELVQPLGTLHIPVDKLVEPLSGQIRASDERSLRPALVSPRHILKMSGAPLPSNLSPSLIRLITRKFSIPSLWENINVCTNYTYCCTLNAIISLYQLLQRGDPPNNLSSSPS